MHALRFIFFTLWRFFFWIPNLKGINGTWNLCNKKYGSLCLLIELKMVVPLYLVHGFKNITMFSELVCAHFPDYMILMCNTGYAVIKWGITLTFSCILTLNQDTNNWLDCMEFSSGLIKARKWGLVNFIKVSSGQINLVIWVNFFS